MIELRRLVSSRIGSPEEMTQEVQQTVPQVTVIPGADSLIGDLLDMDINPPMTQQQFQPSMAPPPLGGAGVMDLLGEGLDSLVRAIFLCSSYLVRLIVDNWKPCCLS